MRKPPQLHRSRRTLDLNARAGPAQSDPAPSHKPPWFTPHAAAHARLFAWLLAAGAWLLAVAAWLFHRLAFLHNTGGFFAVTRLGVPTNHIMVGGRKHLQGSTCKEALTIVRTLGPWVARGPLLTVLPALPRGRGLCSWRTAPWGRTWGSASVTRITWPLL